MTVLLLLLVQSWQPGRAMPHPGFGMAAAAVGDTVYCFGGLTGDPAHPYPRSYGDAYDAARDTWLTGLPSLPRQRAYAGCAAHNGKVYVLGGFDGRYEYRRCDRFDPVTRQWDTVAALPWSVQVPGACSYQGSLYLVGGYSVCLDGNYVRRVLKFVPGSGPGAWVVVDSMNELRASMGLAVANGRMYAVGGKFYNSLATAEYFDGTQWTTLSRPMSGPRGGLAAVAYDDLFICAIGGSYMSAPLDIVEVLDSRTGNWLTVEPLLTPRYYLSAAMADGRLVALGGRDDDHVLGSVETHAAWFPGIADRPGTPLGRVFALVGGSFRPGAVRAAAWQLIDAAGNLIRTGTGPAEVVLGPGVYFYRQQDGACATKVTVIR